MESLFGIKEFYDVTFKATSSMEINGVKVNEGDIIARFDSIEIARMDEKKYSISATGGYDDRKLVTWDTTAFESFSFQKGVFSTAQFNLLYNSKMIEKAEGTDKQIPFNEKLETDENGEVTLRYLPIDGSLQISTTSGEKITEYTQDSENKKKLTFDTKYMEIIVDYYMNYNSRTVTFQTGAQMTNGYFRMEGRTRVKDDNTGNIVTGIIIIPRLKLKSSLSITLGSGASPIVGTFLGEGYPVGKRGQKEVSELIILSDEIDSDI